MILLSEKLISTCLFMVLRFLVHGWILWQHIHQSPTMKSKHDRRRQAENARSFLSVALYKDPWGGCPFWCQSGVGQPLNAGWSRGSITQYVCCIVQTQTMLKLHLMPNDEWCMWTLSLVYNIYHNLSFIYPGTLSAMKKDEKGTYTLLIFTYTGLQNRRNTNASKCFGARVPPVIQ